MSGGLRLLALLLPPLVIGSLLLAGAEAVLRVQRFGVVALTQPLQYMAPGWRSDCFKAGPDGELMTPNCQMPYKGVQVVNNSEGLNDREVDESRPHYRVLVLGDSVTMAAGVATDSIYHAVLEDRLNEKLGSSDFVQFYNYGRGGRSTVDEVGDFESALSRRSVDAALVAVTPGNIWANLLNEKQCDPDGNDPKLSDAQRSFYKKRVKGENLASNLFVVAESMTGLWAFHVPRDFLRSIAQRLSSSPEDAARMDVIEKMAVEKFRHCARRVRAIATDAGIELAWIVLWYQPDRHAEIVRHELGTLGEPVTTMMGIRKQYDSIDEMIIYENEVHPNADVNARFADALLPWLGELGWTAAIERAARQRLAEGGDRSGGAADG